jgi:glucan endo-1,3-beta-D-glucosidase
MMLSSLPLTSLAWMYVILQERVLGGNADLDHQAYPYFQNTMTNPIENGYSLFFDAYDATVGVAGGKPVWVTETGWPISGPTQNQAIASVPNAKTYWDQVGCGRLFGQVNTWWYTLQDSFPTTPSPSFGIVGNPLSDTPLYDLSCSGVSTSGRDVPSASVTAAIAFATAASAQAGNVGTGQKIGSGSGAQGQNAGSAPAGSAPADSAPAPASTSPAVGQQTPTAETQAPAHAPESTVYSTTGVTITSCPSGCPKENQPQTESPTVPAATAPTTLITKTSVLPSASAVSASGCPAYVPFGILLFTTLFWLFRHTRGAMT